MKKPTAASLKRVTPDNLALMGAPRLAALLVELAERKPDMKRRLKMELAAEQGAGHLAVEVEKRLATLSASGSRISWRRRPGFIADLEGLRRVIGVRLAELDRSAAIQQMWAFLGLYRGVLRRTQQTEGEVVDLFADAARDLGGLLVHEPDRAGLAQAIADDPSGWARWLPDVLEPSPPEFAADVLALLAPARRTAPGWAGVIRALADRAGEVDAWLSTWTKDALASPQVSADAGRKLLAAGRTEDARRVLAAAAPREGKGGGWFSKAADVAPDFDWETVWIDYLEQAGQADAAQDARWASFERTLSVERARAFTRRLADFDDVEAEERAFVVASNADFEAGMGFLMGWPALRAAAALIEARGDELTSTEDEIEVWAARLSQRYPAAARRLLRKAAAVAFRRRELTRSERFTQEADALEEGG